MGLQYERKLAKAIPGSTHGQWFEFWDDNGRGWCQPDLLFRTLDGIFILECKLTDVAGAQAQLDRLYRPVVAQAYDTRLGSVYGIVVTRHLTQNTNPRRVVATLSAAVELALSGTTPILHWLGHKVLLGAPAQVKAAPTLSARSF